MGRDGQFAGVGGRGKRGTAGGGSTERLWKCGKQGNEEGHVTCKLKCRGGGKGKKGAGRQRFGSFITEELASRAKVMLVYNSLPSFPGMFCFFLWRKHIHISQKEVVALRDSKGTCGKSQEYLQTGMDVEVGGLLPTVSTENRGLQSERNTEKERESKSLARQTVRQADMESARSVSAYLRREKKLPKRKDQVLK